MTALREGDRISNYLLEAPLGRGSFGEVWRARHHVFDERVAIKVPTDPQYVRNLQREGVVVHGLRHPNIVRAIDLDPYATPPYLVMEYVEGPSLREVIDQYEDKLPIPAAVRITRGMLAALGAAHDAGLLHRDVKPANVLLACPMADIASVDESCVKVTDFGLGRVGGNTAQAILQSGSLTTEEGRSISGTVAYMAPEQREGAELDGRSDLYACGMVLFEMLTGQRPQGLDLPSSIRREVPPGLDTVFQRCYTRRERRYGSAKEMLEDLDRLGTGKPPEAASPPPPPPPQARPAGRGACPSCGTKVMPNDQFCIGCGEQLVESVPRCGRCRAYVDRNDRFCIFCGNDLRVLGG